MPKGQVAPRLGARSNAQTDDEIFDASASVAVSFTDEPSTSTTTAEASLDTSSTFAVSAASMETAVTSAAIADLGAILKAAMAGGYLAHLTGPSYTVTSSIIINVTSTIQGPLGIDLGGATHRLADHRRLAGHPDQCRSGRRPALPDAVELHHRGQRPGGRRHPGSLPTATTAGSTAGPSRTSPSQHVGGYGLDVQGSVFEGLVSNSWMIGNARAAPTSATARAAARQARSAGSAAASRTMAAPACCSTGARDIERRWRLLRQQQRPWHQRRVGHHLGERQHFRRQSRRRHLVPELRQLQRQHLLELRCAGRRASAATWPAALP